MGRARCRLQRREHLVEAALLEGQASHLTPKYEEAIDFVLRCCFHRPGGAGGHVEEAPVELVQLAPSAVAGPWARNQPVPG